MEIANFSWQSNVASLPEKKVGTTWERVEQYQTKSQAWVCHGCLSPVPCPLPQTRGAAAGPPPQQDTRTHTHTLPLSLPLYQ